MESRTRLGERERESYKRLVSSYLQDNTKTSEGNGSNMIILSITSNS